MFNDPLGDKGGDYYQNPAERGASGVNAVAFHWSNALDESRVGDGPYAAFWESVLGFIHDGGSGDLNVAQRHGEWGFWGQTTWRDYASENEKDLHTVELTSKWYEGTNANKQGEKFRGATVYVEDNGVGHVYLEVNGTVFSYGRYDGSYSPSSGRFGPVGNEVLLKENHFYAVKRMKENPTTVYQFPNADANAIYKYMDEAWQSGVPAKHGGMVVSTYFLIGNNCSTTTCGALRVGGVNIPNIQTPVGFNLHMKYPNQFGTGYLPR